MQGKKPGGSSSGGGGGGRSGEPQGDEAQRHKKKKKKVSCFSNITIFLVSECALMLAQGTVGAYLVSAPRAESPSPGKGIGRPWVTSARRGGWRGVQRRPPGVGSRERAGCRRRGAREGRNLGEQVGVRPFSPSTPLLARKRSRRESPCRGRYRGFQGTRAGGKKRSPCASILRLLLSLPSAGRTNP